MFVVLGKGTKNIVKEPLNYVQSTSGTSVTSDQPFDLCSDSRPKNHKPLASKGITLESPFLMLSLTALAFWRVSERGSVMSNVTQQGQSWQRKSPSVPLVQEPSFSFPFCATLMPGARETKILKEDLWRKSWIKKKKYPLLIEDFL